MSGALAFDAAWLFAGFLILVVLLAAGITIRRYLLERGGGTVECGLRVAGGSWRLGVAAYQPHELRWYQIFGFQLRPNLVFSRRTLTVLTRRQPNSEEAASLGDGTVVVECRVEERAVPHRGTGHERRGAHRVSRLARGRPAGITGLVPRPGQLGTVHRLMYHNRKSHNIRHTEGPGKDPPKELVISFTSSHSRTSEGPVIGFAHPAAREFRLGGTQAPGRCCVGGGPVHPRVKCPPEPSGAT